MTTYQKLTNHSKFESWEAMTTMTTEIINPLKEHRLQLHMNLEAFAKRAGIQQAAIGQAEDGLYPHPLPAYLLAIGINPGSKDEQEITKTYHEYQILKRQSNGPATNNSRLVLNPKFNLHEHPLLSWRNQSGLATYTFCSTFCIHMPAVNNFEKNITAITKVPPKSILNPLIQAGFNLLPDLVDEFVEACKLFKTSQMNKARVVNLLPTLN